MPKVPDGTVCNHAPHGPESMRVTSDDKPEWTTRAELGESDEERTGAAKAVPRQVNRLLALALNVSCAPLLDHLIGEDPSLKEALAKPVVLLGAFVPRCAEVTQRLLRTYDLPINTAVCDALLDDSSGKGSHFQKLLLDGGKESDALITTLTAREPKLKSAIDDKALIAALTPATSAAALRLLNERGVEITDAVREYLTKDPPQEKDEKEEKEEKRSKKKEAKALSALKTLMLDATCAPWLRISARKTRSSRTQ